MSKSSKKVSAKSSTKSAKTPKQAAGIRAGVKKAVKKAVAKLIKLNTRKPTAMQEKLIKLFTRKGGCTMHDTWNAGFEYPAMAALKMVERRGYKVTANKVPGDLTVYSAKK